MASDRLLLLPLLQTAVAAAVVAATPQGERRASLLLHGFQRALAARVTPAVTQEAVAVARGDRRTRANSLSKWRRCSLHRRKCGSPMRSRSHAANEGVAIPCLEAYSQA